MRRLQAALAAALLCCALFAPGAARAQGSGSATLDAVRGHGQLQCGIAGNVAGFSLADSQGVIRGLDADGCRAIAAAVLGDAAKVKFVPTTTQNRFTALQSGEIDVLVRETTWTLGREASLGLEFAGVNFYDGTGFLVKKSAGVNSAKQLDGATICVQPGTSTELAIADYFRVNNMKFTPIEIQDVQELRKAFLSGRCDVYSTDSSALATFRAGLGAGAADFVLLPELISKEPLGPMVRKGDDRWFDIVRWTLYAQCRGASGARAADGRRHDRLHRKQGSGRGAHPGIGAGGGGGRHPGECRCPLDHGHGPEPPGHAQRGFRVMAEGRGSGRDDPVPGLARELRDARRDRAGLRPVVMSQDEKRMLD
jgi:general L-amino acid transport system substrate-binding protein